MDLPVIPYCPPQPHVISFAVYIVLPRLKILGRSSFDHLTTKMLGKRREATQGKASSNRRSPCGSGSLQTAATLLYTSFDVVARIDSISADTDSIATGLRQSLNAAQGMRIPKPEVGRLGNVRLVRIARGERRALVALAIFSLHALAGLRLDVVEAYVLHAPVVGGRGRFLTMVLPLLLHLFELLWKRRCRPSVCWRWCCRRCCASSVFVCPPGHHDSLRCSLLQKCVRGRHVVCRVSRGRRV